MCFFFFLFFFRADIIFRVFSPSFGSTVRAFIGLTGLINSLPTRLVPQTSEQKKVFTIRKISTWEGLVHVTKATGHGTL